MKISLTALKQGGRVDKLAIRSTELSLYLAEVMVDGERCVVCDDDGKPLRAANIVQLKERLAPLEIAELVLVQDSAYDEMIGQPLREGSNSLEVPLDPEGQPVAPWLN